MDSFLISVIVPVYNVEAYLSACLDSVLNQTYCNFEIIMVNDGSTDSSTEIARMYAQKDSRIVLIEQSNQGISAARNIALEKTRGEYITFLDSDDLLSSDALEIMLKNILEHQADLCICGFIMKNPIRMVEYNCFNVTTVFEKRDIVLEYLGTNAISSTVWGKMYNKKLFDGISFPVGMINEDAYIMPEVLHKANRAVCISESLYVQNIREGSIMRSDFSEKYLDIIDCEEHVMDFVNAHYPELFDYVAYSKYYAIASVMAKILINASYQKNRDIYTSMSSMLVQEYKRVTPFVTANTKIQKKYIKAADHPWLFKIKFYFIGIIQRIKRWLKCVVQRMRG